MDVSKYSGQQQSNQSPTHRKKSFEVLHNQLEEPSGLLCLFASYNFTDTVAGYVYHYLAALQQQGYTIAFITTSTLQYDCLEKLKAYSPLIIQRENKGLDFASWQYALRLCNWAEGYSEVLLANDSVFGPFRPLEPIISHMNKLYDVWGMTDNYDIDYHIQSYFLHFNEKVIKSEAWTDFWQRLDTMHLPKDEIIKRYEIGISRHFLKEGFKLGVYTSIDTVVRSEGGTDKEISLPLVYWKSLIEKYNFPFLKRELLINNSINKAYWYKNVYINTGGWRKVVEQTDYDIKWIDDFLQNYLEHTAQKNPQITVRKKKILFLLSAAQAADSQQVIYYFLTWLHHHTDVPVEVLISNPSDKKELYHEIMNLAMVTPFWNLNDQEKYDLKDRLSSEHIGLIVANNFDNIEAQQYFSFLNVPQVIYVTELPSLRNRFSHIDQHKQWLLDHITHFIASTGSIKDQLSQYFRLSDNSVSIIPPFINDTHLQPAPKATAKQHELNLPQGAFVVGISGGSHMAAHLELLPAIAAMLCRQQKDIHLLWLDADLQDPLYEVMEADFIKAGISAQVHYLPADQQREAYYSVPDVFVMPSKDDTLLLIQLEMAAHGVPVIYFSTGAASDRQADLGQAVPYLDLLAMQAAVMHYYQDREQLKKKSDAVADTIKNNFTTSIQAPRLYAILSHYFDENERVVVKQPSITIMTHLFYDNTWSDIKHKLTFFKDRNTRFLFSVSEACLIKDELVKDIQASFPNAFVLTTANIGKDIGGKFALVDLYLSLEMESDFIIFLHDKQSPHSLIGESWRNNLQKIVDSKYYKQILQVFEHDEKVGLVGAREHLICEYDVTNGTFLNNNDRIHIFLKKYGITISNYDFFGGTMFWWRAPLIEHFFTKFNPMQIRSELEAGNVLDNHGSTNAHTWERVLSWVATSQGYKLYGI